MLPGFTTKMKLPKPIPWFRNTVYTFDPIKMFQSWKSNVTSKTYRLKLSKTKLRRLANMYMKHKYRTECVPCQRNPSRKSKYIVTLFKKNVRFCQICTRLEIKIICIIKIFHLFTFCRLYCTTQHNDFFKAFKYMVLL